MQVYIAKRLVLFVPTLIGVTLGVFLILRVLPGDVAAMIIQAGDPEKDISEEERQYVIKRFGLDRPIYEQYIDWVWGLARFDPGVSYLLDVPVSDLMKRQLPVTFQLAFLAIVLVTLISLPIGVLAALYQDKWPDYVLRSIAIFGLAMPGFFVGLMVIIILSVYFKWLPPMGFVHSWDNPIRAFQQLIFPAMALGFHGSGTVLRMTRAQMLEVLREDYIRTARAKGLSERVVTTRHALRNASLPILTVLGFQVAALLGGTVVMELIFALPGMGQALIESIILRDMPVTQAYIMYLIVVAMVVNLLIDLTYAWLDPRVKYS